MKKDRRLLAAIAGITLGAAAWPGAAAEKKDDVSCWGVNSCGKAGKCGASEKGAQCGVTDADLAAVKALLGEKEYAAKWGKSTTHDCAAPDAKCGAGGQVLNWTTLSAGDCKAKGGYLVEDKDGKKVAKKA
jgi:hypothetical protein